MPNITLLDLYNEVTGQPWSMFDGDVEAQDEFESTVVLSLQKALGNLWLAYDFDFRNKTKIIKTVAGKEKYNMPVGNIIQKVIKGEEKHGVKIGKKFLDYIPDYEVLEEKNGTPTSFFVKNDYLYLYPTPDDVYNVEVEYFALYPAVDAETDEDKATLENEQDYINIPEKYNQLFKNALLPLSMVYAIASDSDENHSGYQRQYEDALQALIKYSKGINYNKTIGW